MTNLEKICNTCDRQGSIPLICKELSQISRKKDLNRKKKKCKRHGQGSNEGKTTNGKEGGGERKGRKGGRKGEKE